MAREEPSTTSGGAGVRRALVLRHHDEDDAGLIGRAFEARGYALTTLKVDDAHAAPAVLDDDVEVIIVLGSTGAVYDPELRERWLDGEIELLGAADRAGVAILGICFGAQILCHLFGGDVRRAERAEIGWTVIDVVPGVALSSGPWFEYHGDRCELPPGATVWATTPHAVQAFWLGRHFGVQFHPEVDDVQLARWFSSDDGGPRAHEGRETQLLDETRRETPAATLRARELVDTFLDAAPRSSSMR